MDIHLSKKVMKLPSNFIRLSLMIVPSVVLFIVLTSQTPVINSGAKVTIKKNYKIPYAPGLPSQANISIINGVALLSGDIDLGDSADIERFQFTHAYTAIRDENYRWPNGIVPYEFGRGFSETERRAIIDAMNHIINKTNVLFVLRTSEDNFIRFAKVTEQQLGFRGGTSPIGFNNLGEHRIRFSVVDMPLAVHEILHSLGALHEHTRNDRSRFVEINMDNVIPTARHNFDTFPPTQVSTPTAYDFNSIMHYHPTAFGIVENGIPRQTIFRLSNRSDMNFGRARELSENDIRGINAMYPRSAGERTIPYTGDIGQDELGIGQTKIAYVWANQSHNFVNVFVREGQKFEIRVSPSTQKWKGSMFNESNANGYARGIGDIPRRSGNMMQLMGEIFRKNNDVFSFIEGSGFDIGISRDYTATKTGYLVLYGNDNLLTYVDNSGSLKVTIKRVL
jgi:hypothetical protein